MIENIIISSKIDSTFEFEMVAQGINLEDARVLFQTEVTKDVNYDVLCQHIQGDKWSCTIPKSLISDGAYNFKLCVIVEDFYFEPVKGMLSVVSEKTIEVFGVTSDAKKPKPTKPTKPKKTNEDADSIVKKILDKQKETGNEEPVIPSVLSDAQEQASEEIITEESEVVNESEEIVEETPAEIIEEPTDEIEEVIEEEDTEEITDSVQEEIIEEEEPSITIEVTPTPASIVSERSIFTEGRRRELANKKVQDVLESLKNTTPSQETITPEVTGTQEPGKFFEQLDEMKALNEKRQKNKIVKQAIDKSKKKD